MQNTVEITLPLVTVSEANGGVKKTITLNGKTFHKSEHWQAKHKRHKKQKGAVILALKPHRKLLKLPCCITLTRYAPHKLDRFDNLPMAFKWILDACCEMITGDHRPGRADDSEEIDVKYRQIVCKDYGVKIEISSL